jgi:dienelactone hydrolase
MKPVSFDSHGRVIRGELYSPATLVSGQAIIVVHGSDGMLEPWGSAIREYAKELAARGFLALIPNYFEKTDTDPGIHVFSEATNLLAWTEAVSDACRYAGTAADMRGLAPGLLGFSLGGNICLRLRGSARAMVEFFAPELKTFGGIGPASGPDKPPIQIHHGLVDQLVPFAESQEIATTLRAEGIAVQVFSYEGAGHGFAGADAANATASRVSRDRTLAFFESTMRRS